MKHYMTIIADCPVQIIVRVPWPMPRWRAILRGLTSVMRTYGCRQKDIHFLDGLVAFPGEDRDDKDLDLIDRLERAYGGDEDLFSPFWLYDWQRSSFQLVRAARDA